MRKLIILTAVAVVTLVAATMSGASTTPTKTSTSTTTTTSRTVQLRGVDRIERIVIKDCNADPDSLTQLKSTVKCLNRGLDKLEKFVNFFYSCVKGTHVTQYSGYQYDNGSIIDTTALDYSEQPDINSGNFVYHAFIRKPCIR
jgi:hypothetical protein